jgi:hypothetical protein
MKVSTVRAEVLLRAIAIVLALIIIGALKTACGQTMVTAETLGKGKVSYFAATNALVVKDFTTLSLSMGQIWYGLNNKMDIFAGVSDTAVFGKHQLAMMTGGNINLLKSKVVSVSTFHTLSIPMNRRADGSPLWFASIVASRNIGKVVGYTGYSANIPLGNSADKLFTSANVTHNIPIGLAIPKGKWMWFVEYNFGKTTQAAGVGISWTP